jgi:seryl-tRNA synthetase
MEIRDYQSELAKLGREYSSREAASRAQDETAKELRAKIESAQQKREEVQKAIDKKVKERNTEMKVVSKFQEVKTSDIPS